MSNLTGADITAEGRCKAGSFDWRVKFKPNNHEEALRISGLPSAKHEDIPDIDDPEKYDWYIFQNMKMEDGVYKSCDSKYGRSMYCPKTDIKRSLTMGEFYQGTTVD